MFEDPTFKNYYRSCNTDLCNNGKLFNKTSYISQPEKNDIFPIYLIGNGLQSSGGGASPDGDPGENLLVPGLEPNSGARDVGSRTLILLPLVTIITIYNYNLQ